LKEGSTTAEPRLLFKLVARANHSNFPECTECRHNRMEKEQNIASRAPRDRRDATNAKQVAHVRDCSDERAVTSAWVREASRSINQVAELDDKLGSWWNFLPMPENMRFGKETSSRWRYKQTVMANMYPGFGNFYSFVPPFLRTGNNFGCTAFVVSLYRLINSGPSWRLPGSQETNVGSTSTCSLRSSQRYHARDVSLPAWHPARESDVENQVRIGDSRGIRRRLSALSLRA